ncbi:MAG: metallophosphoesterase [Clostridia bacterium]|nr:metallophosphoesterase [Clostridia bacterium]
MTIFSLLYAMFVALFSTIGAYLPVNFNITVEPSVFDCGGEYYSVVWVTSGKGSGYVKYTYNGEEKTVWDASGGLIRTDDTIHSVQVPKAELQGNTYKVGSQQVGFKFGYSAFKRKTVESKEYSFDGVAKQDGLKLLCISDIHEMKKEMSQSVSYFTDKPDMVLILGDVKGEMEFKSDFVDHVLENAFTLSGGEIPVVYTRGNHETRGEFGSQAIKYLPSETGEYYFTFDFGPLSAIVVDSGEDKEDDHEEYSGLIDFAAYREQEYNWLCSLDASDFENAAYKIVFSHDPTLTDHFGKDWTQPMLDLGMDLIVGGHHHMNKFIEEPLPVFIDGGKQNDGSDAWIASMLTLENGTIRMLSIDDSGNVKLDRTITV